MPALHIRLNTYIQMPILAIIIKTYITKKKKKKKFTLLRTMTVTTSRECTSSVISAPITLRTKEGNTPRTNSASLFKF